MSSFSLGELAPEEIPAAAGLLATLSTSGLSGRLVRTLGDPAVRSVTAHLEGQLVAAGAIAGSVGPMGAVSVYLAVAEAARGRGIGTAIARLLSDYAAERPDLPFQISLRDDAQAGRRFAERYGFALTGHAVGRSFDLARADDFGPDAEKAIARADVTIRSSTFGESKELVVSVFAASTSGLPSNTGRPVDPSAAAAHFDPGSTVLLAETPTGAVGLTMIAPSAQPGVGQTQATAVTVAYRGRGVARALKLAGLRYARAAGGERMETQNDSRNAAILALNASVGMEPTVGFWTFVRS